MATPKNVIFIGMTQNGKSSLLQSILRYCGEHEKADHVGIGGGNFAETQQCGFYEEIEAPLKTHRLRQIDGPMPDKNGQFVVPEQDFDLEDACECEFEEVVSESDQSVRLTLIDTPGLSDSNNAAVSSGGMGVVDERHKLRILFALQKIKEVHAICFVVRRDVSYGGDFQSLVQNMVKLITFSVQSTAWNLSFHVIHTNIDLQDRAEGGCEYRQRDFDAFGPSDAKHYFIDNVPDEQSPLETFFHNSVISDLIRSFSDDPGVAFTNLRFPKSIESESQDQILIDTIQQAINELQDHVEELKEVMRQAKDDIMQAKESKDMFKKRVDRYNQKIGEYDSDSLTDIGGDGGDTTVNVFGGGARHFSLTTSIPIADVVLSPGNWENKVQTQFSFSARLQPSWASSTTGSVRLRAKKKDKHAKDLEDLRSKKSIVFRELQEAEARISSGESKLRESQEALSHMTTSIESLRRDLGVIRKSGRSILLSEKVHTVRYFTLDTPISIAAGYGLQASVPWKIAPLSQLDQGSLKGRLKSELCQAEAKTRAVSAEFRTLGMQLGLIRTVEKILLQLSRPSLETAQVRSASTLLNSLLQDESTRSQHNEVYSRVCDISQLIRVLQSLLILREVWKKKRDDDKKVRSLARSFAEKYDSQAQSLSERIESTYTNMQDACSKEDIARFALDLFCSDTGLPIGVYTALLKSQEDTMDQRVNSVLRTLGDVLDLRDVSLD